MRNDSFPRYDPAGGIFLLMAGALAPAPFQPDVRRRWNSEEPKRRLPAEEPRSDAVEASRTSEDSAPRKIGFLERLDRWFWAQQQRDIEAYLSRSADVHDLEQRMRNLERSPWHRYN